ncbi:hypothetical protein D3C84_415790 [compost metagenome]
MELHFYATQFVGVDLFAGWADDDGGLWATDQCPRGTHRCFEWDLAADTNELILVERLSVTGIVITPKVFHAQNQELPILYSTFVMIVMLSQFEIIARLHGTTVTFALKGLALYFHCLQTIACYLLTMFWI